MDIAIIYSMDQQSRYRSHNKYNSRGETIQHQMGYRDRRGETIQHQMGYRDESLAILTSVRKM